MNQLTAFIGRAGSGKDYQCDLLVKKGFKQLAFADALRDIAFLSLDIQDRTSEHYEDLKKRNCIQVADSFGNTFYNDENGTLDSREPTGHYLNFRKYLELLGTQGIRKYDNDFWCKCLSKQIKENNYEKVCISDMRFLNEYYFLSNFAEDNNFSFKVIFCDYRSDRYETENNHESAQMANWFANNNYKDLQEISVYDIHRYAKEKEILDGERKTC